MYVSNPPPPRFILQVYFSFFNVEIVHLFTSAFVVVYSSNPHPFGFTSISKRSPLETLKFISTTLINKDKKVTLIIVD